MAANQLLVSDLQIRAFWQPGLFVETRFLCRRDLLYLHVVRLGLTLLYLVDQLPEFLKGHHVDLFPINTRLFVKVLGLVSPAIFNELAI